MEDKRYTVLVVDDTPLEIKTLSSMLKGLCDVRVVLSGEECLQAVYKYGVDLILLDVMMGGISGFEVIQRLKDDEFTCDVPVIFITGKNAEEDEEKGLSLGAVDYITKPFREKIVKLRVGNQLKMIDYVRKIERFSLIDVLTGLDNRRSYMKAYETEWGRSVRNKTCLGMLILDIDKFKVFNDTYGHPVGDTCLQVFSKAVATSLRRKTDKLFRIGGEEFVVLLPDTDLIGAASVGESVRRAVEACEVPVGEGEFTKITTSVGVGSIQPSGEDDPSQFFNKVDKRLYAAKESGRNRIYAG